MKCSALANAAAHAVARAADAWAACAPSQALETTWSLISAANTHLEQHQPWKQTSGAALDRVLGDALEALRIVAILTSPAVPHTSQAIWERIGLAVESIRSGCRPERHGAAIRELRGSVWSSRSSRGADGDGYP